MNHNKLDRIAISFIVQPLYIVNEGFYELLVKINNLSTPQIRAASQVQ